MVYQLFTATDPEYELPFGPLQKDYQALAQLEAGHKETAMHECTLAAQDQWVWHMQFTATLDMPSMLTTVDTQGLASHIINSLNELQLILTSECAAANDAQHDKWASGLHPG